MVAVVAAPEADARFPGTALRLAMVEDVYERIASLDLVEPVLVVAADAFAAQDELRAIVWPGTVVLDVASGATSAAVLSELADIGADEAVLVAADAPDLPALLIGKLHRALGSAEAAVLPARGGGLVALAARCPVPQWVAGCGAGLDVADALVRLQHAAPRRTSLSVGPGWHRVRQEDDLRLLDPGLEGWEVTRAALGDRAPGAPTG